MMREPSQKKPLEETRTPPHYIEAEQALIGAVLIVNEAIDRVSDLISAEHFYDPLHGRIWETIEREITAGKRTTPITLKPFFEHETPLGIASLPVPVYLGRLAQSATSVINARDYAATIRDAWLRRRMISLGEDLTGVGYELPRDSTAMAELAAVETQLSELAHHGNETVHQYSARAATALAVEMIAKAYESPGGLAGLPTGFRDLDRHLGGLAPSDLIILAGRPSMGKSALASNIAINVAGIIDAQNKADLDKPEADRERPAEVSFYSLEMSAEQVMARELSRATGIAAERLRRGNLNETGTEHHAPRYEFSQMVVPAGRKLSELPMHLDTTGGITIGEFVSRARRRHRMRRAALIVVDYLQLMSGRKGSRSDNRAAEVAEITVGLKALAKELSVPILALSQLSREVERRENKRPQLSDLRESGAIEQDADIVMFVYREEYYLARAEPPPNKAEEYEQWQEACRQADGKAEVIIGKQRHGPIGTVILEFHSPTTAFRDLKDGATQ